jgi:mannitol-specific phosphotransferase system IIBC component
VSLCEALHQQRNGRSPKKSAGLRKNTFQTSNMARNKKSQKKNKKKKLTVKQKQRKKETVKKVGFRISKTSSPMGPQHVDGTLINFFISFLEESVLD